VDAATGEEAGSGQRDDPSAKKGQDGEPLTSEEQAEVADLEARDREVRAHEQAHLSAGGQYTRGGAKFTYDTGPDGQRYATGGEVGIDTSKEATPEATVQKAQVVRRAALAPAEPSGQDRAIAAQANRMESEARAEISRTESEAAEQGREAAAEKAEKAAEAREAQGLEEEPASLASDGAEGPSPTGPSVQPSAPSVQPSAPSPIPPAAAAAYARPATAPPPGQVLDLVA